MHRRAFALVLFAALTAASSILADPPTPREALAPFNDMVGAWRGTGTPNTRDGKQEFWTETITCEWQFKKKDAWIKIDFDKSKNFTGGELRYRPEKEDFVLTVRTPAKEMLTFAGPLKERVLTLERETDTETQRIVFTMLHSNRFLYRYEVRPEGKVLFAKKYQVGATKEGVPFAAGDGKPECVVSGGLGTMAVSHQGKTYYVCCSGCRDEFRENPEKYIKEFEAKKAKKN